MKIEESEFPPCPFFGSAEIFRNRIAPSNSFIGSPPFPWSSLCLARLCYEQLQAAPSLPPMNHALDLRRRGTFVGTLEVTVRDEVECDMRCASSECASRVRRLRSWNTSYRFFPKSREEWNDKSRLPTISWLLVGKWLCESRYRSYITMLFIKSY